MKRNVFFRWLSGVILLWALLAGAQETTETPTTVKRYPPYPDVWDWQVPNLKQYAGDLHVEEMADGDVLVMYSLKSAVKALPQRTRFLGATKLSANYAVPFFSAASPSDEWLKFRGTDEGMKVPHADHMITFPSGNKLRALGWPGTHTWGCYDRLRASMLKSDKDWNDLAQKTLLYVYDKPQRYIASKECRMLDGPGFTYRVQSVFGKFLSLKGFTSVTGCGICNRSTKTRPTLFFCCGN